MDMRALQGMLGLLQARFHFHGWKVDVLYDVLRYLVCSADSDSNV